MTHPESQTYTPYMVPPGVAVSRIAQGNEQLLTKKNGRMARSMPRITNLLTFRMITIFCVRSEDFGSETRRIQSSTDIFSPVAVSTAANRRTPFSSTGTSSKLTD